MSYVLAVDVGTSFTAAAVVRFNAGASPVPECLPLGLRGSSVPSVVYYPGDGPVLVGEAAERRWLDAPGQVVREFKRRIGDDVPFSVGALSVQPEDVFATMARWVADRAAEREGEPASAIFLTHPAAWGHHRLSVIRGALTAQGLADVTFLSEPEAAALHYASQVRVEEGSTIAVYDLGGGTFDTAVLRKTGSSRFELAGRPEGIEDLGGADFDAEVFRYVSGHTGGVLAGLDSKDPAVLPALTRLRRECVEAKEALSADSEANIQVLLPGFQQQVRLVRADFEALIEEPLRETVDALEQSLCQLQLEPADLSAVLLIGGSSRIPLVAQLVSEQLDRPIAVDADPKSSICLGAAVAALLEHQAAAALAFRAAPDTAPDGAPSAVEHAGGTPVPQIPRRPGWRGTTAPAGLPAGLAAAGGGHRQRGAHAPTPTVRLTAVAAGAALLTVLTATAAQSPDGFGSLTAVFVPQAGASTTGGSAGSDGGASPDAAGTGSLADGAWPGDAAASRTPEPLAGIGASATRKWADARPGVEASVPDTGPLAAGAGPDGTAASGALGGDGGTGTGIILDSAPGGAAGTDTGTPTGTTDPSTSDPATSDPATSDPATSDPAPSDTATAEPTPSDTTGTATPTPEPATTTDPAATTDPPTTDTAATDPAATDPATSTDPAPDPTSGPTATPTPEPYSGSSTVTASETALTTPPAA
ncbi:Hsp70 family protein [Arthrobacter sp. C152]